MSDVLTDPFFFFVFSLFIAGLFLFLVFFFFFFSSGTVQCLPWFFFFCSFRVGRFLFLLFFLLLVCSCFFFLLLSIPAFFFVLFVDVLWCLKLSFTVSRFVLSPWRTRLVRAQNRTMLYCHLQHHNNTIINRRKMTSLTEYVPLTLFVMFACERELETEQNCNILTPTLMAVSVVSFPFFRTAQPEAQGLSFLLSAGFLYCILSATSLDPNSIGGLELLRPGVAFPTTSRL